LRVITTRDGKLFATLELRGQPVTFELEPETRERFFGSLSPSSPFEVERGTGGRFVRLTRSGLGPEVAFIRTK
jgi:hypothetical protein